MKEMLGGCCVCSDERGWAENPLVYCDGQGCTVAVHQACYGIVTVPTGPWYCRKCESQERSARVRCELCPSRDGALKRTDNNGWAHVVCALYIPEVRFGNVTTMEPIILQLVPQERFSKVCYICEEQGKASGSGASGNGSRATIGACMQCNRSGCKQQFHVTCAQALGLLCEEAGNYLDNVKYCGYCQHHYSKLKKGGNVKTIPPYKPIPAAGVSPSSSPDKDLVIDTGAKAGGGGAKRKTSSSAVVPAAGTAASSAGPSPKPPPLPPAPTGTVKTGDGASPLLGPDGDSKDGLKYSYDADGVTSKKRKASAGGGRRTPTAGDGSATSTPPPPLAEATANAPTAADADPNKRVKVEGQPPSVITATGPVGGQQGIVVSVPLSAASAAVPSSSAPTPPPGVPTPPPPPPAQPTLFQQLQQSMAQSAHHIQPQPPPPAVGGNPTPPPPRHTPSPQQQQQSSTLVMVEEPQPQHHHAAAKRQRSHSTEKPSTSSVTEAKSSTGRGKQRRGAGGGGSLPCPSTAMSAAPKGRRGGVAEVAAATPASTPTPPPPLLKDSPPSSPGSESTQSVSRGRGAKGGGASTSGRSRRDREEKDVKLFQNGVSAPHMLGNQLNPSSMMAQKMSDTLSAELEAHSNAYTPADSSNSSLVGPPLHSRVIASVRSATGAGNGHGVGTSASPGVPPGTVPQSLDQLLERQWEQGSQFLMEQAQHFDIASLLSCLHQLRAENLRLEEHVSSLLARRDHLLAVNARLAIPLSSQPPPQVNNVHPSTPVGARHAGYMPPHQPPPPPPPTENGLPAEAYRRDPSPRTSVAVSTCWKWILSRRSGLHPGPPAPPPPPPPPQFQGYQPTTTAGSSAVVPPQQVPRRADGVPDMHHQMAP